MLNRLITWLRSLFRRPSPAPTKEAPTMELTFSDGRRIGTLRNVTLTPLPADYQPTPAPPPAPMPKLLNPSELTATITWEGEQAQKVADLFGVPKAPPPPANRQQRRAAIRRKEWAEYRTSRPTKARRKDRRWVWGIRCWMRWRGRSKEALSAAVTALVDSAT